MRRVILVLAAAAIMVAMLAIYGAGSAFAYKNPGSSGKPGFSKHGTEFANCNDNVGKQGAKLGGDVTSAPTNCDHFHH
jgi:hypothetical protein